MTEIQTPSREAVIHELQTRINEINKQSLQLSSLNIEEKGIIKSEFENYLKKIFNNIPDSLATIAEIAQLLANNDLLSLSQRAINNAYGNDMRDFVLETTKESRVTPDIEIITKLLSELNSQSALFPGEEKPEQVIINQSKALLAEEKSKVGQIETTISDLHGQITNLQNAKQMAGREIETAESSKKSLQDEITAIQKRLATILICIVDINNTIDDNNSKLGGLSREIINREQILAAEKLMGKNLQEKIAAKEKEILAREIAIAQGREIAETLLSKAQSILEKKTEEQQKTITNPAATDEKIAITVATEIVDTDTQQTPTPITDEVPISAKCPPNNHADLIEASLQKKTYWEDPSNLTQAIISQEFSSSDIVNDSLLDLAEINPNMTEEIIRFYQKLYKLNKEGRLIQSELIELENCAYFIGNESTRTSGGGRLNNFFAQIRQTAAYNKRGNNKENSVRLLCDQWEKTLLISHTDFQDGKESLKGKKVFLVSADLQKRTGKLIEQMENLGMIVTRVNDPRSKGENYDIFVILSGGNPESMVKAAKKQAANLNIPFIIIEMNTNSSSRVETHLREAIAQSKKAD